MIGFQCTFLILTQIINTEVDDKAKLQIVIPCNNDEAKLGLVTPVRVSVLGSKKGQDPARAVSMAGGLVNSRQPCTFWTRHTL